MKCSLAVTAWLGLASVLTTSSAFAAQPEFNPEAGACAGLMDQVATESVGGLRIYFSVIAGTDAEGNNVLKNPDIGIQNMVQPDDYAAIASKPNIPAWFILSFSRIAEQPAVALAFNYAYEYQSECKVSQAMYLSLADLPPNGILLLAERKTAQEAHVNQLPQAEFNKLLTQSPDQLSQAIYEFLGKNIQ